jgi:hypothetical protein
MGKNSLKLTKKKLTRLFFVSGGLIGSHLGGFTLRRWPLCLKVAAQRIDRTRNEPKRSGAAVKRDPSRDIHFSRDEWQTKIVPALKKIR